MKAEWRDCPKCKKKDGMELAMRTAGTKAFVCIVCGEERHVPKPELAGKKEVLTRSGARFLKAIGKKPLDE